MKGILLVLCFLSSSLALAQNHMFSFDAQNLLRGHYGVGESKSKGQILQKHQYGALSLNFARVVTTRVQAGVQLQYARTDDEFTGSIESYGAHLGGFYNFSESDFTNSGYVSFFAGMEWNDGYLKRQRDIHEENIVTKTSLGKRYPVAFISENFTYSPEVTLKFTNPTSATYLNWRHEIIFKFLQFSVFF